jgi:hypothetical protein
MKLRLSGLATWLLPLSLLPACGGGDDMGDVDTGDTGGVAAGGQTSGNGGGSSATGGTQSSAGGTTAATGGSTASTGGVVGAGGGPDTGGGDFPAGTTDYTFKTGTFSVDPSKEVFKCQDFANPFGKDIGVIEMNTDLTVGSHHMFAFVIPNNQVTLTSGLADCPGGGVEFHDYLTTSGSPHQTVNYPAGIGRMFTAGNGLRLMVHLINTSDEPKDAFVTFKVGYVNPATLQQRAASIFLNDIGVKVPPGQSTTTKSYTLTQDINMMGAGSHMHKQGVHFVATTSTGITLYDGTDWQEPPPKTFDPAIPLKAGTKITWACTYSNPTKDTFSFGESALTSEMCIFPGEFYNTSGTQISVQTF